MGFLSREPRPAQGQAMKSPVAPRPPEELYRSDEVIAVAAVDGPGVKYRRALLDRFEEARVNRDLALEINTKAERAMIEALTNYDEARKALRRISEMERDR